MTLLGHDRYCDEIVRQADDLCALLDAAGHGVPGPGAAQAVPTCPEWDVEQLVRHLGETLRWAWYLTEQRAQHDPPVGDVPGAGGPDDPDELTAWLAGSARLLADALRQAGPAEQVWSWSWDSTTGFWARRMCHETAVHRADAALALRGTAAPLDAYRLDPVVAADALDEWLEIVTFSADTYGLPEPPTSVSGTLHLHATDVAGAEWLMELDGPRFRWRRAHEKADTAVRGPLTALLLWALRRLPTDGPEFEVFGDRRLLDHWLDTARFT